MQTRAAFAVALESGDFDLILADYSLPSFDGLSALRVAQEIRPEVPFVLVSGTVGEETAIETLKSGATDYVLKQRLERLVPAVRRAVREAEERTARKRTEEALQYQLDLTTTITDNAADSLFLWDAEGRVTFMNPAAEQTFGWRKEELLGEVLHDRMHHHYPDGRPYPISECPLVGVFESAQTLRDHEDLFFRKDGSPVDVACSLAPIVVDGRITSAVLVVRDITERKQAEEALRKSERRLQDLIRKLLVAQEEERRRVAYEIHDGLTQVATATHQRLQIFANTHPPGSKMDEGELDRILELAQCNVEETRRVIEGLRPKVLDDCGLEIALRQLAVEVKKNEGLEVIYEEALGERKWLPPQIETAFYRVAQEALTNVKKHAKTDEVRVTLTRLPSADKVRLEVMDEGVGFNPQEEEEAIAGGEGPGERVGYSSMLERVSMLGGELKVVSEPGVGTSIITEVPLPTTASREEKRGHGRHGR